MYENKKLLNTVIQVYFENKKKLDYLKSMVDSDNKIIKDKMKELNKTEFETGNGLIAKITIQNRDSLNEEKAILKLKELGITSAIKTKEYLDLEEIENLIYNQKLNPAELEDCQIKKEVVTLSVKEKK